MFIFKLQIHKTVHESEKYPNLSNNFANHFTYFYFIYMINILATINHLTFMTNYLHLSKLKTQNKQKIYKYIQKKTILMIKQIN